MRIWALLLLSVLTACGTPRAPASRTGFDSSATGTVAKTNVPPGKPRLLPFRPMTTDAEVLQGDPEVPGQPFVIRIRELPGTIVPPHSHPVDEHFTIVSGTWHFGFGEAFDPARLTALPTGSYGFAPKGTTMFAHSPEGAVVQVHGIGPFHIDWRHGMATLEERPGRFRFRRGDRVAGPRGEGRIRQGYASGALIQYEIEGEQLHMAQERDLSAAAPPAGR